MKIIKKKNKKIIIFKKNLNNKKINFNLKKIYRKKIPFENLIECLIVFEKTLNKNNSKDKKLNDILLLICEFIKNNLYVFISLDSYFMYITKLKCLKSKLSYKINIDYIESKIKIYQKVTDLIIKNISINLIDRISFNNEITFIFTTLLSIIDNYILFKSKKNFILLYNFKKIIFILFIKSLFLILNKRSYILSQQITYVYLKKKSKQELGFLLKKFLEKNLFNKNIYFNNKKINNIFIFYFFYINKYVNNNIKLLNFFYYIKPNKYIKNLFDKLTPYFIYWEYNQKKVTSNTTISSNKIEYFLDNLINIQFKKYKFPISQVKMLYKYLFFKKIKEKKIKCYIKSFLKNLKKNDWNLSVDATVSSIKLNKNFFKVDILNFFENKISMLEKEKKKFNIIINLDDEDFKDNLLNINTDVSSKVNFIFQKFNSIDFLHSEKKVTNSILNKEVENFNEKCKIIIFVNFLQKVIKVINTL